jgi:hypothetical protein
MARWLRSIVATSGMNGRFGYRHFSIPFGMVSAN